MTIAIALVVVLAAINVLLLVRNELVYRIRSRRIDEIHAQNMRDPVGDERWKKRYEQFDRTTYGAMVLDLRRWTFRQFYPEAA